ncbi:MAG: NAD(P)/FAD-dependent oxidoreductase, partial [Actinomycetota bacterium]
VPKDPQLFVPLPDGTSFFVWRNAERTRDELSTLHPRDADAYRRWSAFWDEVVDLLRPVIDEVEEIDVERYLADRGRQDIYRLAVAGSAADLVEAFFEHPAIQGAFASQGIIGTWASVRDPGTAWIMTFHALGGELYDASGTWGFARGGMGAVTGAIAAAAREAGAAMFRSTPATEILVEDGRAVGVRLANGLVVRASYVVSGADPKTTFGSLLPDGALDPMFAERVSSWPTAGCVLKVNMALSELPDFTARPGRGPQHHGTVEISPSTEYLHEAFTDAQSVGHSNRPFMEVFVASTVDPSLVDGEGHVVSAFTQYVAPPGARGDPPQIRPFDPAATRDHALEAVLRTLESYAPNIRSSIVALEALGPVELEERFGLPGGDIFHGSLLQRDRFDYRTPVPGLYLCGSGARPGGCVMGSPGRNAASVVLSDLRGGM